MISVNPHELIRKLVEQAGGTLPVAKAMRQPSFQGTLHKIAYEVVKHPSRASAEKIAKHFHIPIEAIYDPRVAAQVAAERFGTGDASEGAPRAIPPVEVTDWKPGASPLRPIGELFVTLGNQIGQVDEITRDQLRPLLTRLLDDPSKAADLAKRAQALIDASSGVADAQVKANGYTGPERRHRHEPVAVERRRERLLQDEEPGHSHHRRRHS